ncbi:MAG: ROK family protein [Thermoleophilia bacterium]|nr:ROK family protein [Thermoleophilia bacterium]MDH4339348.1 ROK family protein [Thermoleophilia bacterium]MDH5281957.1 ROK family protein [Thermoleophilia bacterium]
MTAAEPGHSTVPVIAGVDLGGTKIQAVVLRNEEVVGSARVLTPQTGDPGDVIDAIVETIRTSLEAARATEPDLGGIGIGTPGEVDAKAGAVLLAANVPGFSERVELGRLVSSQLGNANVTVGNDVNVGVLGEYERGAGRPYENLLGVWSGTGVGGGLIIEGQLYDGRGAAGEFGHLVVKPGGLHCSCGRRGCVEAYAGRVSMERRARQLVKRGQKTDLFHIMEKHERTRLSSGVFARALEQGDKMAKKLIAEAAWALGIGMASAQNLLDLEAIIVGGGLGDRLGQPFVDQIVEQMTPHLFAQEPPVVLGTELRDLSGAVGAAVLAGG